VPIFIGRGAPATLMRDLDCLPTIKSKAHHRFTSPLRALPVAVWLRQTLIAVSNTRPVQQGQQTKMEQVYHYLTATKFKQRVDAAIEKFNDMRDDLDEERKFMTRQWAKRETVVEEQRCAATLPVGETGVARARAAGVEGDHPPKGARGTRASARAWRSCLHENSATARKTGETTPAGAGFGASPLRARGRSP
jgi:hypothetical protein